ncbi:MAG: tRNA epoxyqueuosine(34) reductase QueG [Candidatus Eisenbacteria bacterium]|uniref:Epoxyqueuosine reductase n=1 Tax=Eiseniibacteriota bacterium TaxID=2212470 RepID=A0A538U334_UNCEI|nr:MAG: tRNA epoxyqueuosine(34) reductase QueG [Candidatus Eisenbacteria bacterium]
MAAGPAARLGPDQAARAIKARALELGFEAVGIASATPLDARAHYEAWLAAGRHGGMGYLASPKHRARRDDPARLLRDLRSVVCVALCHEPARDAARDRRLGRIARYAAGEDYHRVMRDRLLALERWIERELLPGSRALWYSDTGAILERGWAERAGLGWIGKHAGLLSEPLGSWFLLGEVLVDRELTPDPPPATERCGTCRRCLDACPTGAIVAPYQVDARRCISYLTIELRGPIPVELRPSVGDWIFGCDVCQEVCPWNRFAPPAREARLHARPLEGWTLERFLALDERAFDTLFAGSPIRRARRGGFLRNVCVALGNRGEAAAVPALARSLAEDAEPLVRAHAAWALGEIARRIGAEAAACSVEEIRARLGRAAAGDTSAEVRAEAEAARARASGA